MKSVSKKTYAPRTKTPEQALQSLMERCARAEVCVSDACRLMMRWGVSQSGYDVVIEKLIKEKFIDEQRYADAFVRDKLNFSRWGAGKISDALYQKRIPTAVIKKAMEQVEPEDMGSRLETDLIKKRKSIKDEDPRKVREKLLRFGISRGFDYETVTDTINKILDDQQ